MANKPVCIRSTASLEEASIIVAWLATQGVEAQIADPGNPGVMAFGVTDPEGIEIYVKDEETAQTARKLLKEHDQEKGKAHHPGSVEMTCDSCGTKTRFSADTRGTTQECPECGAYMDVPE
jgi:hypothetical protein